MMENTNQTNYEDLFVDTTDNIAEKVTDSNDFYDDDLVTNTNIDFIEPLKIEENPFQINEDNIIFEEHPITKLEFDTEFDLPVETKINDDNDLNSLNEPILLEDIGDLDEPILDEIVVSEEKNDNIIENEIEISNNLSEIIEDSKEKEEKEDFDPFVLSDLTNEDMDKMIEADTKNNELDDSYVLSNFDVLFDSLYNDVNGANNFISDLIEQKKNVNSNKATLKEEEEKLLKEKEEFDKYIQIQKESIEKEKEQCKEFVRIQKNRIQNEEEKFNNDMDVARAERKLSEEALKNEEQKLNEAKEQFEKYKQIEEEKIKTDKEKLQTERQQFEKEKEIELEKIKNERKELQSQKDQFSRTKELEEKKLELESKNLSQSCARFKELVSQFNSGFQQLPEDK